MSEALLTPVSRQTLLNERKPAMSIWRTEPAGDLFLLHLGHLFIAADFRMRHFVRARAANFVYQL